MKQYAILLRILYFRAVPINLNMYNGDIQIFYRFPGVPI